MAQKTEVAPTTTRDYSNHLFQSNLKSQRTFINRSQIDKPLQHDISVELPQLCLGKYKHLDVSEELRTRNPYSYEKSDEKMYLLRDMKKEIDILTEIRTKELSRLNTIDSNKGLHMVASEMSKFSKVSLRSPQK